MTRAAHGFMKAMQRPTLYQARLHRTIPDTMQLTTETVLTFWFEEATPKQWWAQSDEFDRHIESRFGALLNAAERCELFGWRGTADGRLAEIIVLDQFSRNIHRGTARAFANDPLALALAQAAVSLNADRPLHTARRAFLYMPYMHSESPLIHAAGLALFSQPGMEGNLDFERRHKEIIDRFGRYPHRNAVLGRASTPAELEFLKTPGSSFLDTPLVLARRRNRAPQGMDSCRFFNCSCIPDRT